MEKARGEESHPDQGKSPTGEQQKAAVEGGAKTTPCSNLCTDFKRCRHPTVSLSFSTRKYKTNGHETNTEHPRRF
ncbi:hypothetical protein AAFF_G00007520 [Aldrovandia affinis]|uniref:Uncharacterized protein n=1 Tax=Aldrovandia affinis TaxID=143900 RepID=A0AAD7T600_9TELE|nr:hypothetical protein AAFF_G00007520 [Aldrovandia affinis]